MLTRRLLAVVATGAFLWGCGGENGNGGSGGKQIADFTTAQLTTLCEWMVDKQGGGGVTQGCPGGVKVRLVDVQTCVYNLKTYYSDCGLGEDHAKACAEAIGKDACTGYGLEACEQVRMCSCGQSCPTAAAFP